MIGGTHCGRRLVVCLSKSTLQLIVVRRLVRVKVDANETAENLGGQSIEAKDKFVHVELLDRVIFSQIFEMQIIVVVGQHFQLPSEDCQLNLN